MRQSSQRPSGPDIRAFPNLYRTLPEPWPALSRALTGPLLRWEQSSKEPDDEAKHTHSLISLAVGVAAIAGIVAATRTIHLGQLAQRRRRPTRPDRRTADARARPDRGRAPEGADAEAAEAAAAAGRPRLRRRRGAGSRSQRRPGSPAAAGRLRQAGADHPPRPPRAAASTRPRHEGGRRRRTTAAEAASMTNHVARLYALVARRPRLLRRLGGDRRPPVGRPHDGGAAGSAARRAPAPRAAAPGRVARGQAGRRPALGRVPRAARLRKREIARSTPRTPRRRRRRSPPQRPRSAVGGSAAPPVGARRHAAAR